MYIVSYKRITKSKSNGVTKSVSEIYNTRIEAYNSFEAHISTKESNQYKKDYISVEYIEGSVRNG